LVSYNLNNNWSSYSWKATEEKSPRRKLILDLYIVALRKWTIVSLIMIFLFFVYHFVVAPSADLISLLESGNTIAYRIHITVKSIFLIEIFFSFININVIVITKLLYDKKYQEKKIKVISFSKQYSKFINYFSIFSYFHYLTLILIIPTKNMIDFLKEVIKQKQK